MSAPPSPSITATPGPAPDLSAIHELVDTMRHTLGALGQTFDALGEQTARVAGLGPAIDSAHQVHHLRRQLQLQERKQEERIQEVKVLLRDVLKDQIADHLRGHVYQMIREQIQGQVAEQVAIQLGEQIPASLKEQVRDHRKQIEDVRKSLFNSEARRANALLRSNHLTEHLHPLLRPNGETCAIFPKDLASLFACTAASAKQLVADYELPEAEGDSRERNLNRFMAHIGVAFQMVPAPMPTLAA